ncbi:MAG: AAA family ATPase [Sulfuriferula multivorans]|uniref:AAA family ATPase n=1 Tax=Sulfuriferula multivorans TaxID=1559896 RepID=A0A7C9NRL2_9PROT|nr:AAA family ATPase [Sulfuriferula multivorans]
MSSRYQQLDLSACFAARPQMPEQILPGLIRGTVGAIFGAGAVGKTTLALELGCYRAGGPDWLGLGPCRPGRVIIFAAEDPAAVLRGRLYDMGQRMSADERELVTEHLHVVPIISGMPRDFLDNGKTTDAMRRAADGFDLAMIDTISRFHGGEENERRDAALVMRQMERIAETGPSVVFLGHINKAAALNGQSDQQQAARGSSVWVDESRWVAFMAACTPAEAKNFGIPQESMKNFVRFGLSKANYCAPQLDIWLRRDAGGVLLKEQLRKVKQQMKRQPTGRITDMGGDDDNF